MSAYKRHRTNSTSDEEEQRAEPYWPRFLVMSPVDESDESLKRLSPFAIAAGIKGIAGDPKSVRKVGLGLHIEVTKRPHSDNLLKIRDGIFAGIPVTVTEHKTLNSRKGVIRCRDLAGITEDKICEELASQGVSAVQRIVLKRGTANEKPTDTYILTFKTAELPTAIKVGYLNVRVSMYIPNPLRCFKCQMYGHGTKQCKNTEDRCGKCDENHKTALCTSDKLCCHHCKTDHATQDRKCPKYLQEKEICHLKYTENITFPEARKRILAKQPSYAAATKNSIQTSQSTETPVPKVQTKEIGTQSPYYWPLGQTKPSVNKPNPIAKSPFKTQAKGPTPITRDYHGGCPTT